MKVKHVRYYDKKAEEALKKIKKEKLDLENDQRLTYDLEIEDIQRCGYDMVETFYSNLAYEAVVKEVDLMKAIDNMEAFMEKHGSPEPNLDSALYRMGVLQDLLDISMEKLFMDRSKEVTDYFTNYVIEAIEYDDYSLSKLNVFNPDSPTLVTINDHCNCASTVDFYKIDSECFIDANFGTDYLDIVKNKMKSKICPYRLDINVVRCRNIQLDMYYDMAIRKQEL